MMDTFPAADPAVAISHAHAHAHAYDPDSGEAPGQPAGDCPRAEADYPDAPREPAWYRGALKKKDRRLRALERELSDLRGRLDGGLEARAGDPDADSDDPFAGFGDDPGEAGGEGRDLPDDLYDGLPDDEDDEDMSDLYAELGLDIPGEGFPEDFDGGLYADGLYADGLGGLDPELFGEPVAMDLAEALPSQPLPAPDDPAFGALNARLDTSEMLARERHGDGLVDQVIAWAAADPAIQTWAASQRHPYQAAIAAFQQERLAHAIASDPQAWRAAERDRLRFELEQQARMEVALEAEAAAAERAALPPIPGPASIARSASPRGGWAGPKPLSGVLMNQF